MDTTSIIIINKLTDSTLSAISPYLGDGAAVIYHSSKELPPREFIQHLHRQNTLLLCCPEHVSSEKCVHYGKLALGAPQANTYEIDGGLQLLQPETAAVPNEQPEVSILIPMYQSGIYIQEAIESIKQQSRTGYEVIVVDDGSTDDSLIYAWNGLRKLYEHDCVLNVMPHRGQAASRNKALSLANGRWIFYLDADDMLVPDAIDILLNAAASFQEYAGVCAMCKDFISPDLTEEESKKLAINPEPYRRMLSGCTIFPKTVYDQVGCFDETLPSSETAQWMLRMKDYGFQVKNIDKVTMLRRYHNNNFGRRSKETQLKSYMEIIRRRRASGGK